jgi:hypothetical protein
VIRAILRAQLVSAGKDTEERMRASSLQAQSQKVTVVVVEAEEEEEEVVVVVVVEEADEVCGC